MFLFFIKDSHILVSKNGFVRFLYHLSSLDLNFHININTITKHTVIVVINIKIFFLVNFFWCLELFSFMFLL